jgi:hypothetical protein
LLPHLGSIVLRYGTFHLAKLSRLLSRDTTTTYKQNLLLLASASKESACKKSMMMMSTLMP